MPFVHLFPRSFIVELDVQHATSAARMRGTTIGANMRGYSVHYTQYGGAHGQRDWGPIAMTIIVVQRRVSSTK